MLIAPSSILSDLRYEPETGEFFWVNCPENPSVIGKRAGTAAIRGYWRIRYRGTGYFAHRLAWFFVYREWPDKQIDHINGERLDNRIANLRLATQFQNSGNQKPVGAYGKGVALDKRTGRFRAQIGLHGKKVNLGHFATKEEAHAAYRAAAERAFGEFARCE